MILKSFQVRKYKNVRCSGEVTLDDETTCLVGKNESGKSALLQALYRLNPVPTGHPDTFVALRDYPRRHYAQERDRCRRPARSPPPSSSTTMTCARSRRLMVRGCSIHGS